MDKINYIQSRSSVRLLAEEHRLLKIDASLNPYIGCTEGCLYCPFGHASKIGIKTDFLHYLTEKLSNEKKILHLGLGTCCELYSETEEKHHLVQNTLDIIMKYHFPLQVFTKSELIMRDVPMLKDYSQKGYAAITISLFTLDRKLSRAMEPGAPSAQERLKMLRSLRKQGMFAGVALAPVIPYLSDSYGQLEEVFKAVKGADGEYILPAVLSVSGPKVYEKMHKYIAEAFPKIAHRFEGIYGHSALPPVTYTNRINDMLDELSIKYSIPVYIPRVNSQPDRADIRHDIVDLK